MSDVLESKVTVSSATARDRDAVWELLRPVLRAGTTYALPRDWSRRQALTFWLGEPHRVFVARLEGRVAGTYYLQPNGRGGADHVCNCGYVVDAAASGRGLAGAMAEHSFEMGRALGYSAMQFDFVLASNERAVRLWERLGFAVVGRLPAAYRHPELGLVDALVMHRTL